MVRPLGFSALTASRLLSPLAGSRAGSGNVVSPFCSPASRLSPSAINFCFNVVVLLSGIFFLSGLVIVPSLSLSAVIPSLSPSNLHPCPLFSPLPQRRCPPSPLHPLTALLCLTASLVVGHLPALARRLLYPTDSHLPDLSRFPQLITEIALICFLYMICLVKFALKFNKKRIVSKRSVVGNRIRKW
ncbi:hypothetical protein ACLOJK_039849 [Asimina triloba]